jgi:hypothetical protein
MNEKNELVKELPIGQMKRVPVTDKPHCGGPVTPGPPVSPPSTCFPAGSKVLMADGSTKNIEDLVAGDMLMTVGGKSTKCVRLEATILGNRKMIEFEDSSFRWSEEHPLWARDISTKKQWWWAWNPDAWRAEIALGIGVGLKDNFSVYTGQDVEYAHIDGWTSMKTRVTPETFDYFTPLYMPFTKGLPAIINGYVVTACTNEWVVDYTKMDWTGIKQLETV